MTSKFITADDVATMLDLSVEIVSAAIGERGNLPDLAFRELTPEEHAATETEVEAVLADPKLNKAGAEALARWERGWGEILERIESDGVSLENLTPQYFHHKTMRFQGRYIQPVSEGFEQRLYHYIRQVVYREYLSEAGHVLEFGCGTGSNLLLLHQMFPALRLVGCDWAQPSQEILARIGEETGGDIHGNRFDMFTLQGRENIDIGDETVVMTMHAMEQLGPNFVAFLDYLLEAKPRLCLHIEPIAEFYDTSRKFDQYAYDYHYNRNYLSGFSNKLDELNRDGKITIEKEKRLGFGSQFQEAYSLIVWRVL